VATFLLGRVLPDTLLNQLAYKTMAVYRHFRRLLQYQPLIKVDGITRSRAFSRSRAPRSAWKQVGAWFQKNVLSFRGDSHRDAAQAPALLDHGLLSVAYTRRS